MIETIVKFNLKLRSDLGAGYDCDQPRKNMSGEYVPLAEYQALQDVSVSELVEMSNDMAVLRRLVERVVELGPSLQADSIADVIYGKTANTEKLIQLLDDCKQALEADKREAGE